MPEVRMPMELDAWLAEETQERRCCPNQPANHAFPSPK
nr:hypothetical protein [Aeromonas salmonicida]